MAAKSLRVVAYLDNAPFSWEAPDGSAKGIDADIGRAIARELGVEAEIVLRMPGEKADDDVRANVWRGPLSGGGVGDLMMHVPIDREFAQRNKEAVFGNPYFEERVAVAVHRDLLGAPLTSFDIFKSKKIAVQLGTVADYFLLRFADGALVENVTHHIKAEAGAQEFAAREVAAWMGVRSKMESLLHDLGKKAEIAEPDMDGIVRRSWVVGMAWKDNSRDLGYAAGEALAKLAASGEIKDIFARYGVTWQAPPIDDGTRREGTAQ